MTELRSFLFHPGLVNPAYIENEQGTNFYLGHTTRFSALGGNALQAEYLHLSFLSTTPDHFSAGIRHEDEGGFIRTIEPYTSYCRILTPHQRIRIGLGAGAGLLSQRFSVSGRRVDNQSDALLYQHDLSSYRPDITVGVSVVGYQTQEVQIPNWYGAFCISRIGTTNTLFNSSSNTDYVQYTRAPQAVLNTGFFIRFPHEAGMVETHAMGVMALGHQQDTKSIDLYSGVKMAIDGDLSRGFRAGAGYRLAFVPEGTASILLFRIGLDTGILGRFGADFIYEYSLVDSSPLGATLELALHYVLLPKKTVREHKLLNQVDTGN